jgi:hypothetical protein
MHFSYGVQPVRLGSEPESWHDFVRTWLVENDLAGPMAMLVAGPSVRHPEASNRIEFIRTQSRA